MVKFMADNKKISMADMTLQGGSGGAGRPSVLGRRHLAAGGLELWSGRTGLSAWDGLCFLFLVKTG